MSRLNSTQRYAVRLKSVLGTPVAVWSRQGNDWDRNAESCRPDTTRLDDGGGGGGEGHKQYENKAACRIKAIIFEICGGRRTAALRRPPRRILYASVYTSTYACRNTTTRPVALTLAFPSSPGAIGRE